MILLLVVLFASPFVVAGVLTLLVILRWRAENREARFMRENEELFADGDK